MHWYLEGNNKHLNFVHTGAVPGSSLRLGSQGVSSFEVSRKLGAVEPVYLFSQ